MHVVDLFLQGYSCSESILMPFAEQFGIESDIAARISSGFGFAPGRNTEKTCGVVTGAIMVIGLTYGAGLNKNLYAKDLCTLVVQEFISRFSARRKSVACKKIHATYNAAEKIRHLTGKHAFCAMVTRDAAEILEELLNEGYE